MKAWKNRTDGKFRVLTIHFEDYEPLSFAFPHLPQEEDYKLSITGAEISALEYTLDDEGKIYLAKVEQDEPALD